jgi:hypothetical protein
MLQVFDEVADIIVNALFSKTILINFLEDIDYE